MERSTLGHYRIVRLLGQGGMGEVYEAEDTRLNRLVALKILKPELAGDAERRERFTREARASAALNHPNIVTIHSVEEADGVTFLTLELLDGGTLADLLTPDGLPLARILTIAIPLADAVGAAHQRSITHRDLKPANVMLTRDGRLKVLDFGLAKLKEELQPIDVSGPTRALTGEGRIVGTVAYMSPEQAEGRSVDHRSDVFSLGVILYEMAVGRRPFTGDSQMAVLSSILRDTPSSITDIRHDLPRDLGRIVKRCLAKDPEDRYQTAKDLRNDLRALKEDLSSDSHERPSAAAAPTAPGSVHSAISAIAAPAPSRRPLALGLLALASAIALTAGIFWWSRTSTPEPATAESGPPFGAIGLTRLTTSGTAGLAALSADGRYVAHVVADLNGQSLWLRQVTTSSNVQIVAPAFVRYAGLGFSPDGDHVYYVTYPTGNNIASLYQVPVLGGGTRKIVDDIDTAPSFAPDGKRFAFVRGLQPGSVLMTADADGGNVQQLATRKAPLSYAQQLQAVSWSPDGKSIASVGTDGSSLTAEIVAVDAASGQERVVGASAWRSINSLAWTPDGRGLIVNALEKGGDGVSQVWFVSFPDGHARRISNDLSNYAGISVARDGKAFVTVRSEQRSTISILPIGGGEPRAITNGSGADDGVQGLGWMSDGRIVYTSSTAGNLDIWIMRSDGGNRIQLTASQEDDLLPLPTADGRYIAFVSERDGARGLWRMASDGSGQVRLGADVLTRSNWGPAVSHDSKWVYYSRFTPAASGQQTQEARGNFRIGIEDQQPTAMFAEGQNLPPELHDLRPSPDERSVTGHYRDAQARGERIAILPLDKPGPARLFPAVTISAQWAPDGRGLIYIDTQRGESNLWRLPLDGGSAVQLTRFDNSQVVLRFSVSPNGKDIAIVRGTRLSDVVLMKARE